MLHWKLGRNHINNSYSRQLKRYANFKGSLRMLFFIKNLLSFGISGEPIVHFLSVLVIYKSIKHKLSLSNFTKRLYSCCFFIQVFN